MTIGAVSPGRQTTGVRGRLGGYVYQCNVAALRLIDTLRRQASEVRLERRVGSSDIFDDIKVLTAGELHAYQVKWGMYSQEDLNWNMFLGGPSSDGQMFDFTTLMEAHRALASAYPGRRVILHIYSTRRPRPGDQLASLLQPTNDPSLLRFCDATTDDVLSFDPRLVASLSSSLSDVDVDDLETLLRDVVVEVGQLTCPGNEEQERSFGHPIRDEILSRIRSLGLAEPPNTLPLEAAYDRLIQLCLETAIYDRPITSSRIEQRLDVGLDRASVPQDFPFDPARAVVSPLSELLSRLLNLKQPPKLIVVTGPPGSGKSWALSAFAREWEDQGAPIHYCFERPLGDEFQIKRSEEQTAIANLIAEVRAKFPDLDCFAEPYYGSTKDQLESVLKSLAMTMGGETPVPIVVDGLDHVARTLEAYRGLTQDSSVLHLLSKIEIPDGISVIVGSQPIPFITQLQEKHGTGLAIARMPRLGDWHVRQILEKEHALLGTPEASNTLVQGALERSQGLPLYIHYIASAARARNLISPHEIRAYIESLPVSGEIEEYYGSTLR